MALSGLALCAGVLRLPGAARTRSVALRLVLDGLVIGAALWFVGWVLLAEPTRLLGDRTPSGCPAILLATVTAVGAVGLTFVVGVRSPRPRRELILIGSGVTLVAGAGLGLAVGICQAGPAVALTGAALLPVGLFLVVAGGRLPEPTGEADADVIRNGSGYAFLPMLAMVVSAMYHLLRMGDFTVLGIVAGSVEGFALVARQSLALRDVRAYASRLAEREAHFRELAHTDPLTGLANRRGLLRALQQESASAAPCVLLGLDLDGFKNVNDLHGHDVGDAVLVEVAQRLRLNLRPGDVAARLGGDEFAVLMWARPPEAQRVARAAARHPRPAVRRCRPVGSSSRSASGWPGRPASPEVETLLRNADLALRYAKQRGKNRVERYDVAYDHLLRRRTTLEHEMRGAIERDELHLAFQPVVAVPVGAPGRRRGAAPLAPPGPGQCPT